MDSKTAAAIKTELTDISPFLPATINDVNELKNYLAQNGIDNNVQPGDLIEELIAHLKRVEDNDAAPGEPTDTKTEEIVEDDINIIDDKSSVNIEDLIIDLPTSDVVTQMVVKPEIHTPAPTPNDTQPDNLLDQELDDLDEIDNSDQTYINVCDLSFPGSDQTLDLWRKTNYRSNSKQYLLTKHISELSPEEFNILLTPPLKKLFTMPPFGNSLLDLTNAQREVFARDLSFRSTHISVVMILDLMVDTMCFLFRIYNPNKPQCLHPTRTFKNLVDAHVHLGKLNVLLEIKCQELQPCIPLYGYSRTGQYLLDQDYMSNITSSGQISYLRESLREEISTFRRVDTRQHLNSSVYKLFDATTYIHMLISAFLGFEAPLTYDYLLHDLHGSDISRTKLYELTCMFYHSHT